MADDVKTEQPTPPPTFDELVEQTSLEQAQQLLQGSLDGFAFARGRQLNGAAVNPIEILIRMQILEEKLAAVIDELEGRHGVDDKRLMLRIAIRMQIQGQKARSPIIASAVRSGMKPR